MINFSLIGKELREQRWALILGTIILTALGIFSTYSFHLIVQFQDFIIEFLGPGLAAELELMTQDFSYYLWSQWQPKNLMQAGTVLALVLAAPAIAGEVGRGTIEFLTSRPLSRQTILVSKAVAGTITLSAAVWLSTLAMLWAGQLINPPLDWSRLLAATALANVGLVAIYAIGLLFSALGADAIKSGVCAGGVLLLWSGAGLFRATRFLSPYWHMKGIDWFRGGAAFPWLSLAILTVLAVGAVAAANHCFNKREL